MDNQQATDSELGWLAGIIDGEGWLGMAVTHDYRGGDETRRSPFVVKCELKITNCDLAIIDKASRILTLLGVNPYRREHKQLSHVRRPVYECAVKNMTAMEKVLPPLRAMLTGIKQERAALILRFIALRRSNPGIVRPGYDVRAGARGPRTIRPYTAEELHLVSLCRDLQSRGASETTRETRDKAVKALIRESAQRHAEWRPLPEMI